jgi:hypothetical protein
VPEITIHEAADAAGALVVTRLAQQEGELSLTVGAESLALPAGALDAVLKRYGKPLAEDVPAASVAERLDLGDGRSLVRFRFMARYDVIARDYLVLYAPDEEPLCELATSVAGVLAHLARRFSAGA